MNRRHFHESDWCHNVFWCTLDGLWWFTDDVNAIEMVTIALRIDAFAQPALAIGLVLAAALQAAGDTKSPMYSTAIGMWFIRIVGIYLLGIHFEMGIAGIWLSITMDLLIRAIFLAWRYKFTFYYE